MALPDSTAGAQIASGAFFPAWVGFLDIVGDPVRATTATVSLSFSSTGDSDLDGQTYIAVDPTMVGVTPFQNKEGGSETLTVSLSGIVGPDSDLLNAIGNKANWQGRTARFWAVIYDPDGVQKGAVWNIYTGRMSAARINAMPDNQIVEIDIENYLASLKEASGRTYLDQEKFDPNDYTPRLKIAVANGATKGVTDGVSGTYWRQAAEYNLGKGWIG